MTSHETETMNLCRLNNHLPQHMLIEHINNIQQRHPNLGLLPIAETYLFDPVVNKILTLNRGVSYKQWHKNRKRPRTYISKNKNNLFLYRDELIASHNEYLTQKRPNMLVEFKK